MNNYRIAVIAAVLAGLIISTEVVAFDAEKYFQEHEDRRNLKVDFRPEVARDAGTDRFNYRYHVFNSEGSKQSLDEIAIGYRSGSADLKYSDITVPRDWDKSFIYHFADDRPTFWKNVIRFYSVHTIEFGLPPGQNLGPFSFSSPALPDIVHCYYYGYVPPGRIGIDFPEEYLTEVEMAGLPQHENAVYDTTVGPGIIDNGLPAIELANRLIELANGAGRLGWFKHDERSNENPAPDNSPNPSTGVENPFVKGLIAAKESIRYVRNSAALAKYQALLNEACAQRGKLMTDEAYFLIVPNIEHIMTRLGGTPKACPVKPDLGILAVRVTKPGAKGGVVNAQGVDVVIVNGQGDESAGKTGWGASSGLAVFEHLPPGEYTVKAGGRKTSAKVEKNERAEVTVNIE